MLRTIQRGAKVDTIACAWLISRFIDKEAEFIFVAEQPPARESKPELPESVRDYYKEQGYVMKPAPPPSSFRQLLREHNLSTDRALMLMEEIVSAADESTNGNPAPQASGLKALTIGFALIGAEDDLGQLERELAAYDALYAWCVMQVRGNPPS